MLQETIVRLSGFTAAKPLVISNEAHRFLVAEQLRQLDALGGNILLEPVWRNTAPAIALAALQAVQGGHDPLLLVLAADHVIRDAEAFRAAIRAALPQAEAGALVTFGIAAISQETGYGHIRTGDALGECAFKVMAFVEKPDRVTAEMYLASGSYVWNRGLFLFRASGYLEELRQNRPDILAACEAALATPRVDLDFIRVDEAAFRACPEDSIDYAVMEKTDRAVVVPMCAGWSDVGAFASLWDVLPKDAAGNATRGDVMLQDCSGSLVFAENSLVAAVGLHNAAVVQTKDVVLVAPKNCAQEVKQIVARLKAEGRTEHSCTARPNALGATTTPWMRATAIRSSASP